MRLMPTPLVSVLMTVHNREAYIAAAIESVLAQTVDDFELIIVDDRSTDASVEIARHYASDSRVRLHVNERNLGDYPNRNRAASLARGEYLKYVDADDMMYPFALDVFLRAMRTFPDAALGLSLPEEPDWVFPVCLSPREAYAAQLLDGRNLMSAAPLKAIIRRSCLEDVGGFHAEGRCTADTTCWLALAQRWRVVLCPDGLTRWRLHPQQESAWSRRNWRDQATVAGRVYRMEQRFLEHPDCPLAKAERLEALGRGRRRHRRKLLWHLRYGRVSAAATEWREGRRRSAAPCRTQRAAASEPGASGPAPEPPAGASPANADTPVVVSLLLPLAASGAPAEHTVASVLAQTLSAWELLIVPAGSPGPDNALAKSIPPDPRIRVVAGNSRGSAWQACNETAGLAQGSYVTFLEAGDRLYPHALDVMTSLMRRHGEAVLGVSGSPAHYQWGVSLPGSTAWRSEFFYVHRFLTSPSALIVSAAAFRSVGGFEEDLPPPSRQLQMKLACEGEVVLINRGLVHGHACADPEQYGVRTWPLGWAEGYPWIVDWLADGSTPLSEDEARCAVTNVLAHAWNTAREKGLRDHVAQVERLARAQGISRRRLREGQRYREGWSDGMEREAEAFRNAVPDWHGFMSTPVGGAGAGRRAAVAGQAG